ncbi:uncharacterized protein [Mytilus edulis]|uniref:uncharacterized protein n=1 Tax=Mytilus edulis TaxID=6550 RepID=UPI0039EE31C9
MQQIDEAANDTLEVTFYTDDIRTFNSTQNEDFFDIIAFENNPIFVGIFCGCVFLMGFSIFLWFFFRTNPSERFDLSFSLSVSHNNSTAKQTNYKEGQHGRESAFKLLNETIIEVSERE